MTRFYSPTTNTTYLNAVHSDIPSDATELPEEVYNAVFRDRPADKIIVPGPDGLPMLADPRPPTVDEMMIEKLREVNAECDRRINSMVAGYPATEIMTFSKQETEARAYAADPMAPTPMIDELAANRGITKDDLVSRIIAKANAFAEYTGKIIGYRQKLEDQINAAADQSVLDAIDPLAGWPE